jgi:glycosyltransferase involved in cell wall biosynthesis
VRRRLRVAIILDWFVIYAAAVVNALVDECDVLVVMRDHGYELGVDGPAPEARRSLFDPRIEVCFVKGAQSDLGSLVSVMECRRALRRFSPDVVHAQAHTDWRLEMVAQVSRAPFLLTIHDVVPHPGAEGRGNKVQLAVQERLRARADAILVHAEKLEELVRGAAWHRADQLVMVVPLGPLGALPEVVPVPEDPVVLFFGRVEPYKGLDVLVDAAEQAVDRVPGLRVTIAGRGPDLERCRARVRRPEHFEWRDRYIEEGELPALFGKAALVALPYREASQSAVVPLAFSHGRTVVASRVGGLSEAVDDGVDGVLVPVGDASALADALVALLTDRTRLLALSEHAARTVRTGRLSSDAVRSAHMRAYTAVCEGAA